MTVQDLKNLCRDMSPDQHDKVIDMLWLAIEGKTKEHSNLFKEIKDNMGAMRTEMALMGQRVMFIEEKIKENNTERKNKDKFWYETAGKTIFNIVLMGIVYLAGSMGLAEVVKAIAK